MVGCNLVVSSKGNWFMREVAALFAAALSDAGVPAAVVLDQVPAPRPGVVDVIVAPHEYFFLEGPRAAAERLDLLGRCAVLATEQPGSAWWERQRDDVHAAALVLDLSHTGVTAHRDDGTTAVHAQIGYHPSLDRWGGDDRARPIDLTFLGCPTPRRLAILAELAPLLSHRQSRLLMHDAEVPVVEPSPYFVTGDARYQLLASSKILLNVHSTDTDYFEWFRAIDALANGAVLLTEPSRDHEPLEPMTHFVPGDAALLPAHATGLLANDILRTKIAYAAYDLVRTDLRMSDLLAVAVVPALAELADRTSRSLAPIGRPVSLGADLDVDLAPPPPATRATNAPTPPTADPAAATLALVAAQIDVERQLSRQRSQSERGAALVIDERFTPAWAAAAPQVSVVLAVRDAGGLVLDAIGSVLRSRGIDLEIVVVDDGSSDSSRAVLERFVDEHPDAPVLAMGCSSTGGLVAARNLGIDRARTDRCFVLDADDLVYPDALATLARELDSSGAAFSYSIIEVFGADRTLRSNLPWDVGSLLRGPYLDAMCLVDRRAWRRVGGFAADVPALHGWEDHAFFVALAAAGLRGAWVPEPLCRHHRDTRSTVDLARLDGAAPLAHLRATYPDLDWP